LKRRKESHKMSPNHVECSKTESITSIPISLTTSMAKTIRPMAIKAKTTLITKTIIKGPKA
jgi:hypothetical protein